ncbi:hypothetical protein GCM10011581_38150 [Saccharopolyspora subtropica]|uniref:DUF4383 domain-containing protein n=1 Tax=Saccharopolyspora thermophila TaxID=89367 RepID=A0A917NF69_9PSEU|nr:DUF4383 domain-containing protein [Saccharopolyspora subtropica]GGI97302.1 hypothetical protein GCM10011581_38150 [Saccharopolyspora subtropica]
MRMDRYLPPDHPLSRFYRVAAAIFGACLIVFGALGLANRVPLFTTSGIDILGLSSNGLLAVVSVVVGAVLIGAAAWGGAVSSSTTAAVGVLFFLSGLINLGLLNTPWNVFAFKLQNVVFSLVAGLVLMFFGFYGRVSGGLPADNPYVRYRHHEPPAEENDEDILADQRRLAEIEPLCEAEHAVAEGHPTPEQERLVRAETWRQMQEERRRAYQHYRELHRTAEQQISAQNLWADFEVPPRREGREERTENG